MRCLAQSNRDKHDVVAVMAADHVGGNGAGEIRKLSEGGRRDLCSQLSRSEYEAEISTASRVDCSRWRHG
jgi:hypothetical protein